ncbi:hypothetical protein [Burkholderia gladioli]|uniref:hypothetical protein n=1 Tax=Burkholderia gladioli TaxID=28095 RepID=UPI003D1B33D7
MSGPTDRFAEAVTAASTLGGFTTRRWIKEEETVIGDGCWGAVSRKADLIGGTQLRPRREGWQAIDGTSTRVQTRHDCATTKVIQVWVEDEDDDDGGEAGEAGADGDGGAKGHWELREVREIEPSVDDTSEEGRGGAGNGRKSRYQSWYGYGGYVNYGYPSPSPGTVMPSMRAQYRAGSGGLDERRRRAAAGIATWPGRAPTRSRHASPSAWCGIRARRSAINACSAKAGSGYRCPGRP